MYKKSPPSEADCLLLALELLYVWRALYTCSETVLNRILSGTSFLCSAHYILWSLSVTWCKLGCVAYSMQQQKYYTLNARKLREIVTAMWNIANFRVQLAAKCLRRSTNTYRYISKSLCKTALNDQILGCFEFKKHKLWQLIFHLHFSFTRTCLLARTRGLIVLSLIGCYLRAKVREPIRGGTRKSYIIRMKCFSLSARKEARVNSNYTIQREICLFSCLFL